MHAGIRAQDTNAMLEMLRFCRVIGASRMQFGTSLTPYDISSGQLSWKKQHILSTEGMMKHARTSDAGHF